MWPVTYLAQQRLPEASAALHVASYCKIITSVVPQLRLATHGAASRTEC